MTKQRKGQFLWNTLFEEIKNKSHPVTYHQRVSNRIYYMSDKEFDEIIERRNQ